MEILLYLGLIIIFALCPPIGAVIFFAIIFSGGKSDNFKFILEAIALFVAAAYIFI